MKIHGQKQVSSDKPFQVHFLEDVIVFKVNLCEKFKWSVILVIDLQHSVKVQTILKPMIQPVMIQIVMIKVTLQCVHSLKVERVDFIIVVSAEWVHIESQDPN